MSFNFQTHQHKALPDVFSNSVHTVDLHLITQVSVRLSMLLPDTCVVALGKLDLRVCACTHLHHLPTLSRGQMELTDQTGHPRGR